MALATKKLLTSLAVGGAVGVASLVSMTSNPGTVKTADVQPKAPVVKAAPCPPGTVDTPHACVREVKVAVPRPAAPAPAPATVTTTSVSAPTRTTYQEPQEPQEREHGRSEEQQPEHESGD